MRLVGIWFSAMWYKWQVKKICLHLFVRVSNESRRLLLFLLTVGFCYINTVTHKHTIDLFTDTAAILNLLDLRSIMGCPGGTRSVFKRAFRAKRELHCIYLGEKAIVNTSKHGATIFFARYNLLSRRT